MESKYSTESFLKGLFIGEINDSLAFPYPSHDTAREGFDPGEVKLMIDAIRDFAAQHIDSVAIDQEAFVPESTLAAMAEMGLFGLTVPSQYGGFGLSQAAYARVTQELVRQDASAAIAAIAHQSIGIKALLLFGSKKQKEKYLPSLASGKMVAGFALTEPGAGSDAYSIQTTAKRDPAGDGFLLNGQKIWITNGGIGDFFTVFAKTEHPDKPRVTAFIVTRDMAGFASGSEEKKMGIRGSSTTTLTFDNVKVPCENVIGEVGKGFKIAMTVLNSGRLGLGAGCIGGIKNILELCTAHAMGRKQFDKPIAEFGLIKEKIGRMMLDNYALESMVFLTAGMIDGGAKDYAMESAACKIFGSEALMRAANEALQIAGGAGFMQEYPYERILRDSRIMPIFEGTNEVLRCFIALNGLKGVGENLKIIGDALNDPIKSFGLLFSELVVKKVSKTISGPKIELAAAEFQEEVRLIEGHVKDLQTQSERVLRKYRKKIWDKQFIQKRLAEACIDLYAMVATVSRASAALENEPKSSVTKEMVHLTKSFCEDANHRVGRRLADMEKNIDEALKAFADLACKDSGYQFDII